MSDNPMPLVLDSLEIKNFRAFKHLRIEKLGRVNLIVGKNNVGKSSVLEALWLYAHNGSQRYVWQVLSQRNEGNFQKTERLQPDVDTMQKRLLAIQSLFYGRKELTDNIEPIEISPVESKDEKLSITIRWYTEDTNDEGSTVYKPLKPHQYASVDNPVPRFAIKLDKKLWQSFAISPNSLFVPRSGTAPFHRSHSVFTSASGLQAEDIGTYWDNIALSDLEIDVLKALDILAPEVVGVNLIGEGNKGERIAKVRTEASSVPIPLRSMGEGMNRMFGIALALVNAKDGMLLIDEVDTGLHYSVLPDLWKLIFEVAHRLNVQVFATSHSWDCIQAFQQAAANNENEEGVLIRLEDRKAGVGAVVFDERDLAIVTREQIEVR